MKNFLKRFRPDNPADINPIRNVDRCVYAQMVVYSRPW